MELHFDVAVIGGGHAGCEAALAAARMGARTVLLTINLDTIAQMSCNPAIGGLAKGQLVREIDALGGEMGKVIDATGIQFRMLNTSKGPAVHSPRAQADKKLYQTEMKRRLEAQPGLTLRQEMVDAILVRNDRVLAVATRSGLRYRCDAVILTTGTFLNGLIHVGPSQFAGGRIGEPAAERLSGSLADVGFELGRLKTGTPPRVNGRTIDYSTLEAQPGDDDPRPFSFSTASIQQDQLPCHVTYTNPETHDIIRRSLDRAPLYTGQIKSTGPRYCPSIEVKIVRFEGRDSHQLYLEPEGRDTLEVYCNGLATSIPQSVQEAMVHSIRGLENAEIMRYGYAIEYDFAPPPQLWPTLETKRIENLYFAGQINGTSGYEEAGGQGVMAGINAAAKLAGKAPLVLDRSQAYIGVLIDDLVTKGTEEPYRMFTSRAEYRLLLRQDNADRRLTPLAREYGLIDDDWWERLQAKERAIERLRGHLESKRHGQHTLAKILSRPAVSFADLIPLDSALGGMTLDREAVEQVEIEIKYEGYVQRQEAQIRKFRKMEGFEVPPALDYAAVPELRREAAQKLAAVRPVSLGQAARISGVSPADISVLSVYLTSARRRAEAT